MRILLHRFRSPTPAFWRKIQKRAALVGAGLGTMVAEGHMPELLVPYLKYVICACGIMALMAQLTCDTPPSDQTAA